MFSHKVVVRHGGGREHAIDLGGKDVRDRSRKEPGSVSWISSCNGIKPGSLLLGKVVNAESTGDFTRGGW